MARGAVATAPRGSDAALEHSGQPRDVTFVMSGIALVAHVAYHLGAIRQMLNIKHGESFL